MVRRLNKESRQILWNWEMSSEENYDGNPMVRYHLVIIDDKDREGALNLFLGQLQKFHSGEICVRKLEGKVENTHYRYLFVSYDSPVAPVNIDWGIFKRKGKSVTKDMDLRERETSNGIEVYIGTLVGKD